MRLLEDYLKICSKISLSQGKSYDLAIDGTKLFIYRATGNCKQFVISWYNYWAKDIHAINALCLFGHSKNKGRLLIDVQKVYTSAVENTFKEYVIGKIPYENLTGASMTLYLIDMYKYAESLLKDPKIKKAYNECLTS